MASILNSTILSVMNERNPGALAASIKNAKKNRRGKLNDQLRERLRAEMIKDIMVGTEGSGPSAGRGRK